MAAEKATAVRVRLLGPFSVSWGSRTTGSWPRPSARRLCQLVLVAPGRRVSRDLVCEELFPELDPRAAARSVSKALSMARRTLSELGEPGGPAPSLLEADLSHIWASQAAEVDRLSPAAREVVRPASVLGAEFPLSLLAAVCATAGPVGPAVGELCTRDLLQEVAGSPDPAFRR